MNNQESINKFLTEKMGEHWHIRAWSKGESEEICACGRSIDRSPNPSYFTWTGFGKLWAWVKGEKWWPKFCAETGLRTWIHGEIGGDYWLYLNVDTIDPEVFATELAKFLGWKEVA